MNNSNLAANSSPISLSYLSDAVISSTTSINNSNTTTVATLSSTTTPIIGQKRMNQRRMSASSTSCSSSSTSSNSKLTGIQSSPSITTNINQLSSSSLVLSTNTMIATTNQQSINTVAFKVVVPKSPKPQRTLCILEHVTTGLNLSINELRTKVADLTSAVTNGYNAMAKQLLQSESYLRHLEQRIATLNKLENSYNVHLKMKDGIQNMFEAYKKSPGNQNKNLTNIKHGWKDCIQKLCAIEAQTEALLGTFQFQIEKLIGFARLCPGDTYEILIKYGNSTKFKTRTKICKDNSQHWENTKFAFKITVHDQLLIKINEIKFLGKNILIGERLFDTKDLFSTTQTQRLTLNANTSGTLKLSMLITWLPFENCEESFIYYNPTQYLTINNKNRLSSYTMTKLTTNNNTNDKFNSDLINNISMQMRSSSSSQSIADTSINKFNNLLSAIIDTDDLESESSSCDPANSSSSSSTTSTSSSTKKPSQSQDSNNNNNNETKSPTDSNSNLDDNQLSTSLNSLSTESSSTKNEENMSREDNNNNKALDLESLSLINKSISELNLNININELQSDDIDQEVESVLNKIIDDLVESQSKSRLNFILADELLVKLDSKLDELKPHYIELNELHEQIETYHNLLNRLKLNTNNKSTDTSSTSLILDDLQQYFDFLNSDDCDDDTSTTKLETKELKINLPDDFYLFLNNCLTQINLLIDDLNELHKIQTEFSSLSSLKLAQLESILFDKLNTETLMLKQFNIIIFDLNEKNDDNQAKSIIKKINNLNDNETDEQIINLWLKSTQTSNTLLLNATKLELISNLKLKNTLLVNKLLNKITKYNLINIYQFNTLVEMMRLINELDAFILVDDNDTLANTIDNINLDYFFNNRVYSSTVLSFLIDEFILNKQINLESFLKRLKALNPIKTADVLLTLLWEEITDGSSSEEMLILLLNFIKLINQNDDNNKILDESLVEYVQKKIEALSDINYYVF